MSQNLKLRRTNILLWHMRRMGGFSFLYTYNFSAPAFYEKQGYKQLGVFKEDIRKNVEKYYFCKQLRTH